MHIYITIYVLFNFIFLRLSYNQIWNSLLHPSEMAKPHEYGEPNSAL